MRDNKKEKEEIQKIINKYADTDQPEDDRQREEQAKLEYLRKQAVAASLEGPRDRKHNKRIRTILSILSLVFILSGIALFMYPIISQSYYQYKQNKLQAELKELVLENMQQAREELANATPTPAVTEEPEPTQQPGTTATPAPTAYEFAEIPLDEDNDEEIAEATTDKTKSLLEGQTLYGSIEITSMNLFYAIVEGTTKENLAAGIGHMTMTADIGEVGNCAIAGHRGGTTGKYFKNIDKLGNGDIITLTNIMGEVFDYVVYDSFIVEPDEVWVIKNTGDGTRMLTLITCENSGKQRLIVRARVQE